MKAKMKNKSKIKSKSKDYIKGFKHGVNWMKIYSNLEDYEDDFDKRFKVDLKEAIKSLKEGR
jgi:hypothetical protein